MDIHQQEYDFLFKFIVVGDPAVGKSAIMMRYVDNVYDDRYIWTIGVDFKIKNIESGGKRVKLQIWDTAGQERFRQIAANYFRGSHGCIAIYDITNRESFTNIENWIQEYKDRNNAEVSSNILLIGNKWDLSEHREVSEIDGRRLSEKLECSFFETSAKNDINVEKGFESIVETVIDSMVLATQQKSKYTKLSSVKLQTDEEVKKTKSTPKKKKCC